MCGLRSLDGGNVDCMCVWALCLSFEGGNVVPHVAGSSLPWHVWCS
jgi:hypothetical protein